jgi:hypothetical protein
MFKVLDVPEDNLTVIRVEAGSCGFVSHVKAKKENKRTVRIQIESDCESLDDLGFILEQNGPFGIVDFMSANPVKNKVFQLAWDKLPHAACPAAMAIIKACEVELGLNVPCPVSIQFETCAED